MITNDTARRIAAFTIVTLFLIIGTDFEASAQLSVAFAYLILISALLAVGPIAFGKLTALVGPPGTTVELNPGGNPGGH